MPELTYEQRLDAIREYLAKSDQGVIDSGQSLDGHNCRLDELLRRMLVAESVVDPNEAEIKDAERTEVEYAAMAISRMYILGTIPGLPRPLPILLCYCAHVGVMSHIHQPGFLDALHEAMHEEERLLLEVCSFGLAGGFDGNDEE